jgi:hypothetical protein
VAARRQDGAGSGDGDCRRRGGSGLRAARAENGIGRTYLLVVACMDAAGNTATRNLTVAVPYELREPELGR